ncbi:MAG: Gfo/Idh/MocA family oxidoreductase, partial [Clostridia bacterium]|nr:Gfo/Idh/MocA family oxidoreductase [Clostridia bacterium]
MKKKRYVIVGASVRCRGMFLMNLVEKFADTVEVTGVYDLNRVRAEHFKKIAGDQMTIYDDFEEMLDAEKPDAVLVTTTDKYHHEYIIRALKKGYNAISEKPITNTYEKCVEIAKAVSETGRS